ncbi:hypothetical protein [Streptosporangium sp. NPDC050280]|uniref:hypothetical protein n=1 Tax=unclassified Streptosporangium TaxID=2632669 RepID=UPI00342243C4
MCAQINTEPFEFSHGAKPRGEGNWFFEGAGGTVINLVGRYSEQAAKLPAGTWKVLP